MSSNKRFSFRRIPDWVYLVLVFGVLYATGLHTEVIGQAQRLLLATGIRSADVPSPATSQEPAISGPTSPQADFMLTRLDGKTVPLESLRGKTVFLNVWATWCPPCIAEMPNIQRLYEKADSSRVAFVMLSVDEGNGEKIRDFIDRKEYTFPVYRPAHRIPEAFQSSAIPTTFIISPQGRILSRQEGMANYDTPEMLDYLEGRGAN